jgi:hypothetical protein
MLAESEPLKWWETPGVSWSVVIAFGIGVLVLGLGFLPNVEKFYEDHKDFKHILDGVVALLGLGGVALELAHNREANEYRAERNAIASAAKADQEKATAAHEKAAAAQEKIAQLQTAVHGLELEIERRITKVRLWVRVHIGEKADTVVARVSNLSDFDLWINQVRLIVTKPAGLTPAPEVFGGGNSVSRGHAEDGYSLFGRIMKLSGDQSRKIDMVFYVEVEAQGVTDEPVTETSPPYELEVREGRVTKLEPIWKSKQT